MSREDFVCLLLWEDFVPGRILCREDFVQEDFEPGRILCREDFVREDFEPGRILCREANVLHPTKDCCKLYTAGIFILNLLDSIQIQ